MAEKPLNPDQVVMQQGGAYPSQGHHSNVPPEQQQPYAPGFAPPPAYYPQGVQGQPGQQVVVMTTTTAGVGEGAKPSSYLGFSIFTLICCNLICGIIALVFSLQTDTDWRVGQYESARNKSKTSLILNIVAVVCGVVSIALALVIAFVIFPGILAARLHG